MIKIGQEIPLTQASSNTRWNLKIIGHAHMFYQYFPSVSEEPVVSSSSLNPILLHQYMEKPVSYFKEEQDPNDKNKCSKRFVSFVISRRGYDISLKLFVFPKTVVREIKKQSADVYKYNWEIIKKGAGLGTIYFVEKLDPVEIDDNTLRIVNDAIESVSVKDAVVNRKRIFITAKYTDFNRFDIMDI